MRVVYPLQARERKAVDVLVQIISKLAEEKILGRACRVIANLSQDSLCAKDFLSLGVLPWLLKTLKESKTPKVRYYCRWLQFLINLKAPIFVCLS